MSIQLYALDGCPWCDRVHDALADADVDYETIAVDPLHADRNDVKRVSGQRGVPVLVDETRGVTMCESANILKYVERTLR
jgi:glutaredoxin